MNVDDQLVDDLRVVMGRRAADPTSTPVTTDTVLGEKFAHYHVTALLGEGGMARVYRAVDDDTHREVALKLLKREYQASPDISARFAREALSMSHIRHENVVQVYDCPKDRDTTGIAMELLTGGSLRDLLRTAQKGKRRLGIEAITQFALQATSGLGAAHQVGIVHRDVKPANLLLSTETNVKVADFGVVLALESATWLTGLGHRIGTPAYMSPEQCQGERVYPPSDVYSLGVTMYELATGRLPFEEEAGSPFALMLKHIQEPAPDPRKLRRNLPNWLAWIILKCLDKNPEQRYADGQALAEAITAGPHAPDLAGGPPELEKPTWRVNAVAIREQLQRLPQRAVVAWACRCARRVQHLSSDPRLGRTITMAEATLQGNANPESQESLSAALQRIQRLRTTSLKAAYSNGSTVIEEAASHAAIAAAAASSCAASRCAADAAADAAFVAQSAVTAMELAKEPVTTFWQCAQRDFQVLLAARLGPEGTIGKPIPPDFWKGK